MFLRTILITVALGLLATGAQAQLIVGSDTDNIIFHIDVATNVATPLFQGTEGETWGMAYDGDTNTLYWNNGSTLFSSPYSMSGLTPVELGTIMFNSSASTMVSLAYRDGMLLGTKNITTEAVYEIDPTTLVATQLYIYPSAFDFGGLGVDATTNLLFGLNDSSTGGQGRGLYEIDTVGQTATFRAPYPAGETDIDGLATYNGLAYYVTDQPGDFYIFDIATGAQVGTIPSPFTASGIFSAAAWVSEATTGTEPTTWGQIKGFYR